MIFAYKAVLLSVPAYRGKQKILDGSILYEMSLSILKLVLDSLSVPIRLEWRYMNLMLLLSK